MKKLLLGGAAVALSSTMAMADYFPMQEAIDLNRYRADRVMYGSDFPNIPYAWDRELKMLKSQVRGRERLEKMTAQNAAVFFDLDGQTTDRPNKSAGADGQ